jgi:glycosyltransferase involved in cell wall biosynthesis
MRILFISSIIIPWPPYVGTVLRSLSLIDALERLGNVDFLFFSGSNAESILATPFAKNRKVLDILPRPRFLPGLGWDLLTKLIGMSQNDWLPYYVPGFNKLFTIDKESIRKIESINLDNYDVIFFIQMEALWWFKSINQRKNFKEKAILDVDTLMYTGVNLEAKGSSSYFKMLARKLIFRNLKTAETDAIKNVAVALVCSKEDKNLLAESNVQVIPNVFPDQGQISSEVQENHSKTILFVGTLSYKLNRLGIEYFINSILPRILEQDPSVKFQVIGRTAPDARYAWSSSPGVDFIGTVDETRPYIEAAAIEVCPVLQGLGTRVKIIEALSFGKPIVSTTIGAYGIDIGEDDGLFRSDTVDDTVSICLELLRDPVRRKNIGIRAKRAVMEQYSQQSVNNLIEDVVSKILI